MNDFIKLSGGEEGVPFYVRKDAIAAFQFDETQKQTWILVNDSEHWVKETPEEILSRLGT